MKIGQRNVLGAEGDVGIRWIADSEEFHLMGVVCFAGKLCSDHHCARDLNVSTRALVYWVTVYIS